MIIELQTIRKLKVIELKKLTPVNDFNYKSILKLAEDIKAIDRVISIYNEDILSGANEGSGTH